MKSKEFLTEYSGRINFEGTLCILDEPSDKSPSGGRGHQILLSKEVAETYLEKLIGAPINYKEDWSGHNIEITIGLISKAWIEDDKLKVLGHLITATNPNIIDKIKSLPDNSLGMSYEMLNAKVENINASIWKLIKAPFTGAAILFKNKAAYQKSSFKLLSKNI